jgi:hypothetical protein
LRMDGQPGRRGQHRGVAGVDRKHTEPHPAQQRYSLAAQARLGRMGGRPRRADARGPQGTHARSQGRAIPSAAAGFRGRRAGRSAAIHRSRAERRTRRARLAAPHGRAAFRGHPGAYDPPAEGAALDAARRGAEPDGAMLAESRSSIGTTP